MNRYSNSTSDSILLAFCRLDALRSGGRTWVESRAAGQGTVEYSLVAAGIAVLALAVIGVLSGAVQNAAASAASAVSQAGSGAASGAKH
jgi:hypothetical protein